MVTAVYVAVTITLQENGIILWFKGTLFLQVVFVVGFIHVYPLLHGHF